MDPDETSYDDRNLFRQVFKYFKKKNTSVGQSYMDHVKLVTDKSQEFIRLNCIEKKDIGIDWETRYGMSDSKGWFVFTFSSKPGLIFIKNPFKLIGERYWIARCLKDFTRKPNRLNIDSHNIISADDDWWEYCQRECNKNDSNSVLEKLRWATLGYHYNWDTKEYSEESRNEFPEDLKALCQDIGKVFGFEDFNPQAGIINMYHKDSCLHGHTDHSEVNLNAPLFSFSLGQSALFLIGGKTLQDKPLELTLHSGDIIIMSKEARLFYHGVPKIFESHGKTWNEKISENQKVLNSPILDKGLLNDVIKEEFWNPFESYVRKSRINMSVRQVF